MYTLVIEFTDTKKYFAGFITWNALHTPSISSEITCAKTYRRIQDARRSKKILVKKLTGRTTFVGVSVESIN